MTGEKIIATGVAGPAVPATGRREASPGEAVSRSAGPAPAWSRQLSAPIEAGGETVFRLLAEAELWPAIFRHIKSVRVLKRDGHRRLIAVRASWHGIPIGDEDVARLRESWRDEQVVELLSVVGLFNYLNRFAESLGVDPTRPGEGGPGSEDEEGDA